VGSDGTACEDGCESDSASTIMLARTSKITGNRGERIVDLLIFGKS
jgi:hypothetical protein